MSPLFQNHLLIQVVSYGCLNFSTNALQELQDKLDMMSRELMDGHDEL